MEGVLLKMKKGITGNTYWKPHWFYADLSTNCIMQFSGENKPSSYGLYIKILCQFVILK